MNIRPIALGLVLLPGLAVQSADAAQPADIGTLLGNRIVGMWATEAYVSAAACTPGTPLPTSPGRNTMVINAGGTAVENPRGIPGGAPGAASVRTMGLGKWSYDVRTGQYKLLLRIDWYSSDGTYAGYAEVDRTILLSNDRNTAFGPVVSTRYAADGSILGKVCGESLSTRL